MFELMRLLSSLTSSGSHLSLFHPLRNLKRKLLGSQSLGSGPSSWYSSNVLSSVYSCMALIVLYAKTSDRLCPPLHMNWGLISSKCAQHEDKEHDIANKYNQTINNKAMRQARKIIYSSMQFWRYSLSYPELPHVA